ncbi:energy-coupling factor transporter transmembrane component T family protein [Evansella tamaricis]|uniref:Energy-coupling factor transporter transmembrane protein EcfT n=1 Tax=Evansella tamaricis TaxID=2069301 RepID=A0ABS6JAQ7_9BACI|nr:energy-coupling factor transporter transmembrane component T [Evansella tamaricis]MBU9710520.1 energy-coupling factor transporter transmembrane protein EcfT [Evansella tamaricis]
MLQINEKDTFIKNLYPMTKIWFAFWMVVGIFTFTNYYLSAVVFVAALILIYTEGLIRGFKVLILAAILLGVSLFMIQGILNPSNETVVWEVITGTRFVFYQEGLTVAGNVYSRIVPLIAVLYLAIRTLNMTELGVALNKAGISYRATFVLTSTFQIIPVLKKEMFQIINAQKSRGLNTEGSLLNRMKAFIPLMVPLIQNSMMNVQNQVVALESKGFNSDNKKTYYRDPQKRAIDTFIVLSVALFGVVGIAYRILLYVS